MTNDDMTRCADDVALGLRALWSQEPLGTPTSEELHRLWTKAQHLAVAVRDLATEKHSADSREVAKRLARDPRFVRGPGSPT